MLHPLSRAGAQGLNQVITDFLKSSILSTAGPLSCAQHQKPSMVVSSLMPVAHFKDEYFQKFCL